MKLISTIIALIALASFPIASAKPPLEAYSDVPSVRAAELSPSGDQVTFINRIDGQDYLMVYDFVTSETRAITSLGDYRARGLRFISDQYLVFIVSEYTRRIDIRGAWENSAAFSVDLDTGKIVQLLRYTDDIFPAQSGLGRIIAIDDDGKHVYMPVFRGSLGSDPSLDVVKVSLESGRGLRAGDHHGEPDTIDWIVNASGEVIAREDFDERKQTHKIFTYDDRRRSEVYSEQTAYPATGLIGVSSAGDQLMLVDTIDSEYMSLYAMSSLSGQISEPIFQRDDADIEDVLTDANRVVLGVRYSGMSPTYEMFDSKITAAIDALQQRLPSSAIYLTSWSDDFSRLLFYVSGGAASERYYMLDRNQASLALTLISTARPEITTEDVGEVMTIEYKAADGLTIPAVLTWPASVPEDARENLPLVVLPHGGPESYDSIGFDWLAQFLANEGYLVLQPNFRGSAGFGAEFRAAGHGEWGRKMQGDINAGAEALASVGWADPERTCIVGWSYGGYAALAGGALAPDIYKCVASIAGVSDLIDMLQTERRQHGARSATYNYWTDLIGDPSDDKDAIEAVSPYRLAENFKAPVLLIHGDEDTVVPARQSRRMEDALDDAGKDVTYLEIDGDDHSLVSNESRIQALEALRDFLALHLGAPS